MTTGRPQLDTVTINSINVDSYKVKNPNGDSWTINPTNNKINIDTARIYLSINVTDVLTIDKSLNGKAVTIQRGVAVATEEYKFRGNVIDFKEKNGYYIIVCADKLNLATKKKITKSFDIDIDSEAGVYSEIFKTMINDYTPLTADNTSVENTGTTNVAKKFIGANTSVFERLKKIVETLGMKAYYNHATDLVNLESLGYTNQTTTLETGVNISNSPSWDSDSSKLFNSVEVRGAVQEVGTTDTGQIGVTTGYTTSDILLAETPLIVKVWSDAANPPTTLRVGGTESTTDVEYTVDESNKKILWTDNYTPGASDYVLIEYTTLRPRPVEVIDEQSIVDYTNDEPWEIVLIKKDMKDRDDALLYANQYLADHKDPIESTFLNVTNVKDLSIGQRVLVNDTINSKNDYYYVESIDVRGPYRYDKIKVTSNIIDKDNYTWDIQQRIKRIEEELDGLNDILLHSKSGFLTIVPTLTDPSWVREKITDSFIVGHYVNSLVGIGDILDYMNTGSAANWSGSSCALTDSTTQKVVGTHSLKCVWTGGAATGTLTSTQSYGDISSETGSASGTPSQGTVGFWLYVTDSADVTSMTLKLGSGASDYTLMTGRSYSSVDGYDNFSNLTFSLQDGWNYILFDLDGGTETGTPDWTSCDYSVFDIVFSANKTVYIDYFTVSESNYIALNGVGSRKMVIG